MALKWGILSAGMISHDFCIALSTLDPEDHRPVAVAARDPLRAEKFAKLHKIPKFYSNYDDLFKDPEIDVIYIGTIHPHHLATAKRALDFGKPVLVEKPLTMNAAEARELVSYAKSKSLFLMEGLWSRFFPAYRTLVEKVQKGVIGDPKQIFMSFGTPFDVPRANEKELGGGTILDRGLYCVQLTHLVFGAIPPVEIVATGHLNSSGVDDAAGVSLKYPGGRIANFITDNNIWLPNEAFIVGTKGTLKLESPFWSATKLKEFTPDDLTGKSQEWPLPTTPGKDIFFWNSQGLAYQCHEVKRCIRNGLIESPVVPHSESILLAEVLESIRKKVGVVYPQD